MCSFPCSPNLRIVYLHVVMYRIVYTSYVGRTATLRCSLLVTVVTEA